MKKLFTAVIAIALVAGLAAAPAWSKTHNFKLTKEATINGVELAPGNYKLEINESQECAIYHKGEVVVKAQVEVKQLSRRARSNSVLLAADGTIREIRLDKTVVVFAR